MLSNCAPSSGLPNEASLTQFAAVEPRTVVSILSQLPSTLSLAPELF